MGVNLLMKKYIRCSSDYTVDDAISLIKSLAGSQGFYNRLYRTLTTDDEAFYQFEDWVEEQNFSDDLDLILALES